MSSKISDLEGQATSFESEVSSLQNEVSSLQNEASSLQNEIEEKNNEIDEFQNGAENLLSQIKYYYEQGEYQEAIDIAQILHEKHYGTTEDEEAIQISQHCQDELNNIAESEAAEQQAIEEAAKQSEQEKVHEAIRITSLYPSSPNSAGGVDLYINWVNNSDKTIKYVYFSVQAINAVGDPVKCEIRDYSIANCEDTGPYEKGEGNFGGRYWDCMWYNSTITKVKLTQIQIDYMDGTSVTFDNTQSQYAIY